MRVEWVRGEEGRAGSPGGVVGGPPPGLFVKVVDVSTHILIHLPPKTHGHPLDVEFAPQRATWHLIQGFPFQTVSLNRCLLGSSTEES